MQLDTRFLRVTLKNWEEPGDEATSITKGSLLVQFLTVQKVAYGGFTVVMKPHRLPFWTLSTSTSSDPLVIEASLDRII